MSKPKPSLAKLHAAYKRAVDIHKNYLVLDKVKLPAWKTAKGYWLAILIYYSPEPVHKDEISDIVRKYMPHIGRDQQVRHLKRDGWNIESPSRGKHSISDPYRADSGFTRQKIRQLVTLTASDFDEIKKAFGNMCATCGAKEGAPSPRYGGNEKVKLQKAHKDPSKSLKIENTIPQCQFCNRAYKDDFTFDDKGRVKAVASIQPVKRATKEVKNSIKDYLLKGKKG